LLEFKERQQFGFDLFTLLLAEPDHLGAGDALTFES
jgi:hypothetical protein